MLSYHHYADWDVNAFSFSRLTAEAEHYVPFLNKKRVLAFHAAVALSYHDEDQVVPFYLQPTLGGPRNLRGFRRYRFTDDNSIALNAEYRWTVLTGFQLALFADAGKVFAKPGQISLSNLEASPGFGARFGLREGFWFRVDTGFSHEGYQIWFQVKNVF